MIRSDAREGGERGVREHVIPSIVKKRTIKPGKDGGILPICPCEGAVREVQLMQSKVIDKGVETGGTASIEIPPVFSLGWRMRLKSPTTSQGPRTLGGIVSMSSTKLSVKE